MSELSAAMGLTLLEDLDQLLETNRVNYDAYRRGLTGIPGLSLMEFRAEDRNNHQYIVVEVDAAAYGCDRDRLVEILHQENVRARRYFYPACHRMEPYVSRDPVPRRPLPATEHLTASPHDTSNWNGSRNGRDSNDLPNSPPRSHSAASGGKRTTLSRDETESLSIPRRPREPRVRETARP